jgi:ubiquinone/menaquinone biosynthesis C-methylase UbiE
VTKSFDRIADSYDATRGGEARGRWLAKDLHPFFAGPEPLLEIGIGTGAIALGLSELGHTVMGIDIGIEMAKRARERIGSRVAQGDAECLPIRSASVDRAYSVWLMHLVDVATVFREVARILRPGGCFIVSQGQDRDLTPVEEIEREMFSALRASEGVSERSTHLVTHAEAAGLSLRQELTGSPTSYGVTPEKAAQRLEQRSRSALWDLDDERWEAIVVPAIEKIRALPHPNEQLKGVTRARLLVFERPGDAG